MTTPTATDRANDKFYERLGKNLVDTCSSQRGEIERLRDVLRRYASIQPLDKLSAKQISDDLFAICGDKHTHRRSIGSDECLLCGHDLRHEVHTREQKS